MKRSVGAALTAIGGVVAPMLVLALVVRFTAPPAEGPVALSGQSATRTFDVANFTGVETSGQWQVTLERGDAWAVEVTYPVELERAIDVRKRGDSLVLGYTFERSWWSDFGSSSRLATSARVVMPALEKVDLSGASKVALSGFEGDRLVIDGSGAVVIEGRDGRYQQLDLHLSGAGRTDLAGVATTNARVDASGAHNVTLRMAGGSLSADISGTSHVEYFGTVSSQNFDTSGLSTIEHRD